MCWTSHFYHCHETLNILSTATHLLLSVGLHLPDPLPAHRSAKQKVKAEHWDNQSAPNLLMGFSSYSLLVFISFIRIPLKKSFALSRGIPSCLMFTTKPPEQMLQTQLCN